MVNCCLSSTLSATVIKDSRNGKKKRKKREKKEKRKKESLEFKGEANVRGKSARRIT